MSHIYNPYVLLTPEGRQAEYDRLAGLLWECADLRTTHEAARPDCNARPVCGGSKASDLLRIEYARSGSGIDRMVVMVALGELARIRAERDAARAEVAEVSAKAMRIDAELVDAVGTLTDVQKRMVEIETQLREWEEAADVIGPVHPID